MVQIIFNSGKSCLKSKVAFELALYFVISLNHAAQERKSNLSLGVDNWQNLFGLKFIIIENQKLYTFAFNNV